MEKGMLNGQQTQNLKGISSLGRLEDNYLAHVAKGERVLPAFVANKNPKLVKAIDQSISKYGVNPNSFIVGSEDVEINPQTGLPEFGWLSKIARKLKKAVKKIAPIAAVIPGPWQPFATVYNKANALNNIAKGEATLGDVLTLGAGGTQKVGGEGGAWESITSGDYKNIGGGLTEALGTNVGSFMDAPGKYLSDIGKQVAKDQRAGYGGIFQNVGPDSYGGQFIEQASSLANPLSGTGIMNAAYAPELGIYSMEGQMMPIAQGQDTSITEWLKRNFDPNDSITENGVQKFKSIIDGNYYTVDQAKKMYQQGPGGSFFGFRTPKIIKGIGDAARGIVGGVKDTFTAEIDPKTGKVIKKPIIDPKLMALALMYGKLTRDAAIRQSGGMQDIRESLRPDLAQQGVYNPGGGFNVGINNSRLSGIANPRLNPKLLTMPSSITQLAAPLEASYETMPNAPVGTLMPERFIPRRLDGDNVMRTYATGGQVIDMRNGGESAGPGTGTSDDVPAMLSDGEFVMTAKATRGAGAFDVAEQGGGIMLLPTGEASRETGTENMTTLMETFARYG
jgi:hypothetical protein